MSRREVKHYKAIELDGLHAVVAETKSYGSLGPDPGRTVDLEVLVSDVSREYAEILAREFTKADFVDNWPSDRNIFDVVHSVSRQVDMWTGPNAEAWGENPAIELVY